MLMQNSGVTNKEHYGMLCYFWSGQFVGQFKAHPARPQGHVGTCKV